MQKYKHSQPVDFMIIGAQKSGTTSLAFRLTTHPQVRFCAQKEPHFFSLIPDWKSHIHDYHMLYGERGGRICGEASTSYTFLPQYPHTSQSLFEYNSDLRLIYIMRNPVERVISAYSHGVIRGRIAAPIDVEVFRNPALLNRSRYAVQIRPYLDLFPRNQLLLLEFEEYVRDTGGSLRKIAEFLGIDPLGMSAQEAGQLNKSEGSRYPTVLGRWLAPLLSRIPHTIRDALFFRTLTGKHQISEQTRELIWRFLEDDVAGIEALMERRLPNWHPRQRPA